MVATSVASKLSIRNESAAVAASPASFQPLKATTSAGLRSSGRSIQRTASMHPPYPTATIPRMGSLREGYTLRQARGDDFEAVAALLEEIGREPVSDETREECRAIF